MKINKLNKVMGVVFTAGMLLSMLAAFSGAVPASAGTLAFSGDPSGPSTAGTSSKVVTSSMTSYAISSDGKTIYAVDNSAAIYKSTNGGSTFNKTSFTPGQFAAPVPTVAPKALLVAVAPDNPNLVAIASNSNSSTPADTNPTVFVSSNGGTTFTSLTNVTGVPAPIPGGWTPTATLSDLEISAVSGGVNYIGVAGSKSAGVIGLSYYNFGATVPGWTDATVTAGIWTAPTIAGLASAKAIAFSPNFASDRTFVAVTENVTNAFLQVGNLNVGKWDAAAGFTTFNGVTNAIAVAGGSPRAASVSLAPTYLGADSSTRIAFVGITTAAAAGVGSGVYRFNDATSKLISNVVGIKSVAYNGTLLVAGEYDSNVVWNSIDMLSSAPTMNSTSQFQSPSGSNPVKQVEVAFSGTSVVATSNGAESAFSVSTDKGVTFNDISLIRTSVNNLNDFYTTADAAKAYLITDNGGGATGRIASVSLTIDANGNTAAVTTVVNTTSAGNGYAAAPAVTIGASPAGVTAAATSTLAGATVASITIATQGTGYFTAPSVTIAPPTVAGTTGLIGPGSAPTAMSLWRYDGSWTRVLAMPITGVPNFIVRVAPENDKVLYLAQVSTNNLYYSDDSGDTKWSLRFVGGSSAGSGLVQDLAVESATTAYYVTSGAKVAQSTNSGFIWGNEVSAGTLTSATTIQGLGAKNLIVTGGTGSVAYSVDSGVVWTTIGAPTTVVASTPLVVTSSGLTAGKAIYAIATNSPGDFVYRNTIGSTAGWEKISLALVVPAGAPAAGQNLTSQGIIFDKTGSLYVSAREAYVDSTTVDSILFKTIDPTKAAANVEWGAISFGGTNTAPVQAKGNLYATAVSGNTKITSLTVSIGTGPALLSSVRGAILSFTDSLNTASPVISNPKEGETIRVNTVNGDAYDVAVSWPRMSLSSSYTVQVALDSTFNTILATVPVNSALDPVSVVVGPNQAFPSTVVFLPDTTYYIRVRSAAVTVNNVAYAWFSPYSKVVTVKLATVTPPAPPPTAAAVKQNFPTSGQTSVGLNPTFSWSAVTGATSYEIQVDTDANFAAPIIKNSSVFNTVFVGTTALKNSTVYYWRVRATVGTTTGPWTTDVFTTTAPAAPPATTAPPPPPVTVIQQVQPPPTTPGYIWAIIAIGAILIIAVLILVMRTGRKS